MDSLSTMKYEYALALRLQNGHAAVALEAQAYELLREFRERRSALQDAEQRRVDAEAAATHERPKRVWCPLNLFARSPKGSLTIGWQLVNISKTTKARIYEYIGKQGTDYDLRKILCHAKPFEVVLIEEFEQRARAIRKDWQQLVAIRKMVRAFTGEAVAQVQASQPADVDPVSDLAPA